MMRARPGSQRAVLTAEQRAKKPPASQPIFRTHPITGRTILYCNPGYATRIDGMPEAESAELLAFLFEHQEQEKYFYAHAWAEGDVLMWDNIGTVHNAVADYLPHEPRYMRRVQVMATKDYVRLDAGAKESRCGQRGSQSGHRWPETMTRGRRGPNGRSVRARSSLRCERKRPRSGSG